MRSVQAGFFSVTVALDGPSYRYREMLGLPGYCAVDDAVFEQAIKKKTIRGVLDREKAT